MTRILAVTLGAVVVSFVTGLYVGDVTTLKAQQGHIYELRTYTTAEGRLPALLNRFGEMGEIELFHKHGMRSVGYWVPNEESGLSENTMIYMLAHDSREVARESWQGFGEDPEWGPMREESQRDGPIVTNVESVFLHPTDFSPAK